MLGQHRRRGLGEEHAPDPPIVLQRETARLHEAAAHALGRLGGTSTLLEPERLLYMYVREEILGYGEEGV